MAVEPPRIALVYPMGRSGVPRECMTSHARQWASHACGLPNLMLYQTDGQIIDTHPSVAGQYLNALTFYAALFAKSPVGAAHPHQHWQHESR